MPEPGKRKLTGSWNTWFDRWLGPAQVPSLFREWAGVAAVSGALERRCWMNTIRGELYPNLYIWLVAFPGIGKGLAIQPVSLLWNKSNVLNTASESATGKGLFDEMLEQTNVGRVDVSTQTWLQYSSILVALPEFGTFLPTYDVHLINFVNDLYDCGPHARDRTRGGGFKKIENPHICILAGTQPGYIASVFPKEAFELGLTSRTIMVWSEEKPKNLDIFGSRSGSGVSFDDLLHDFRVICALVGEFVFTAPAKATIQAWIDGGLKPEPTHPKLLHYRTRRIVHALKVCMCMSAAERDDLQVTEEHVIAALDLLLRTEELMPKIFSAMTNTEFGYNLHEIQEKILIFARTREKMEIKEEELVAILAPLIAPQYVMHTFQLLVRTGFLVIVYPGLYKVRG